MIKTLIEMFNEVLEEAEKQKSKGTINLIDDLNEAHGKHVWMLRSFTDWTYNRYGKFKNKM